MDLGRATAVIRPRDAWEAIDLGFMMARRWWKPLLYGWAVTAVPVMLIGFVITPYSWWFGALLFWWLKPLYERVPLYMLGKALFGEMPDRREVGGRLREMLFRQALPELLWRRFSLKRSFNAPVVMLEGLSGPKRRARLEVLQHGQGAAAWLTVMCVHFEMVLYLSGYALLYMLIPPELEANGMALLEPGDVAGHFMQNTLYFLSVALIAPFYVAAGFALYLNRRIQLEGWDIELVFRRLRARTERKPAAGRMAVTVLLGGLLLNPMIDPPRAASSEASVPVDEAVTPEQARSLVERVLDRDDFGATTLEKRWVYIGEEEADEPADTDWDLSWMKSLGGFLSGIIELLLWLVVGLVVLLIAYRFRAWSYRFGPGRAPDRPRDDTVPETLFGLAVTEESLPDDLLQEFRRLRLAGNVRGALGLLYRASLIRLMTRDDILFSASHTEGECLRLVERCHGDDRLISYFRLLTGNWIRTAYAHHLPDGDVMERLGEEWPVHFGQAAATERSMA